jgi:hypothetical protein
MDEEVPGMATRPTPWTFDPVRLGGHECDAWVGYYRRDAARRIMARFFALVARAHQLPSNPVVPPSWRSPGGASTGSCSVSAPMTTRPRWWTH